MHKKGADPEEAALRALHHWNNDMEFDAANRIEDLEDGTARVLAVVKDHAEKRLIRTPSGQLM